mgnify:CR=1 FL=1
MNYLNEIRRRSKSLYWGGFLHFLAALVFTICIFFDARVLGGISIYVKPIKFAVSIGVFLWTMAWYLYYLPQVRKVQTIKFVLLSMLTLEMLLISIQAIRGELSHFNISSIENMIIFQVMGLAILVNTIMVFWSFRLFAVNLSLPDGYKRAIRLSMLIFIVASLEGYLMAANLGHTVGAPDGQEGLFFLNWAKAYGDLRIFHFLGLHALQLVPLFAWFFAKDNPKAVNIFALAYFLLSLGTLWNALAGRPLF